MSRPLRIDFPGAFHHVTNRGARRQSIFYCDEDRLDFLELVGKAHERFGIIVHSFCLMGNHIHLIVETPEAGLSKSLHLIESGYVPRFNRRHELDGPLFKGRFYSQLIQEDLYLKLAVRYVERNPLAAELTTDLLDFPWSSFRLFFEGAHVMPEWLSSGALDSAGVKTREQLRSFVYTDHPAVALDLDDYGPAIGDDDFVAAALERSPHSEQTIGCVRSAKIRPSQHDIDRAVSIVFDVEITAIRQRSQGRAASARLAAIGLQQDIAGKSLRSIADRFQLASGQSAGVITTRYRQRLHRDPFFALKVEQVKQLLLDGRLPQMLSED